MSQVKAGALGMVMGMLICALGALAYFNVKLPNAPDASVTPYEEAKLQARANIDRMIREKEAQEAAEAAAEEERNNRPSTLPGGPGSTAREAVGVWADPVYGCQYITGGGDAPHFTPRMQFVSGMGPMQVCSRK